MKAETRFPRTVEASQGTFGRQIVSFQTSNKVRYKSDAMDASS